MHLARRHVTGSALAVFLFSAAGSPFVLHAEEPASPPAATAPQDSSSPAFSALLEKAEKGDADAQAKVGTAYCYGFGVAQDYHQGYLWLLKAAAQKNTRAESWLGRLFASGLGVPQDEAKAFQWFLAAADSGDALDQMEVARRYAEGKGVEQDYTNSSEWYAKAAAQGNADAQFQLGLDYLNGKGVFKDPETGFKYLLEAATQNIRGAQYNVALCYWNGVFVTRDPIEAYKWCSLASHSPGDKDATALLPVITKSLTVDQIKKGEILIDDWLQDRTGTVVMPTIQSTFASGTSTTMPFDLKGNEIILKATIAGHENLKLAMDTGASLTSIDGICVSEYNIPKSSEYRSLGGIGKDMVLSNRTQNLDLHLPGLSINQVSLTISPAFWQIDGLLGYDILRNYVIKIDYVNKTVEFMSPQSFDPKDAGVAIPCFIDHTRLMVKVKLKNNDSETEAEDFVMDTGCYNGFIVSQHFLNAHPQLAFTSGVESRSEGVGGMLKQEAVPCSEAELGEVSLRNPPVSLVKQDQGLFMHLNGIIGNKIWRNYDVTIDYPNGKVYLKPNAGVSGTSPDEMPEAAPAPPPPTTTVAQPTTSD